MLVAFNRFLAALAFPATDRKTFSRFSNSSPEAESKSATLSNAATKQPNATAPHSSNKCAKCYEHLAHSNFTRKLMARVVSSSSKRTM